MFVRRLLTTIRTDTNYIALFIPLLTFFLGTIVVNYMSFPNSYPFTVESVQANIKIIMLATVGVIGFSFNSVAYIVLPVQEKEL
jgi:hypothetical protein